MATETERLVIETVNAQKLDALNTQLAAAEKNLQANIVAGVAAGKTNQQIEASVQAEAMAVVGLRKQINALGVSKGSARQAGLNFAYMIQDVTSVTGGLNQMILAASNNIQMMAVNMGIGTKALVGLTVGVAVLQVIANNWDKIKEAITGTASEWSKSVDGMKKKLEELEAKKIKVGTDLMEIESLKHQIKQVEDAIRC